MTVDLFDRCGYFGWRVRVMIDGKMHQEYFSLVRDDGRVMTQKQMEQVYLHADERNAYLKNKQAKAAARRREERKHNRFSKNGTGVCGIHRYIISGKDRHGNNKKYTWPAYVVGVKSDIVGKPINTAFSIKKYGEKEAWERAVKCLAAHKGIKNYQYLLNRGPNAKQTKNSEK